MLSLTKNSKRYKVFVPNKNETLARFVKRKKEPEPPPPFFKRQPVAVKEEPVEKPVEKLPKVEIQDGKIVVYTCVTGGYDNLITPKKTDGVDYICFTDNLEIPCMGWLLRPIPEELSGLTKVKQQRLVKVLAHRYLSDYDISIWVDGSVEVKGNVKEFISSFIYDGHSIFIPRHPARSCIYKECIAVKSIRKDTTDLPEKQMKKYKSEGYPEANGLVQSNIMVRWHNDEECKKVMEIWGEEIKNFSHRDQLSFNYALWKSKSTCFKYLDKKTCNSKYFYWNTRHGSHQNKTQNRKKTK